MIVLNVLEHRIWTKTKFQFECGDKRKRKFFLTYIVNFEFASIFAFLVQFILCLNNVVLLKIFKFTKINIIFISANEELPSRFLSFFQQYSNIWKRLGIEIEKYNKVFAAKHGQSHFL